MMEGVLGVLRSAGITPQVDLGNFSVGVATAFIALVTLFIAVSNNRAVRNQKIADYRRAWIEDLRTNLAEFHAVGRRAAAARALEKVFLDNNDYVNAEKYRENFQTAMERMIFLRSYITLMLNVKETQHVMLERRIYSMADVLLEKGTEEAKDLPKFHDIARAILKSEWDRLKRET